MPMLPTVLFNWVWKAYELTTITVYNDCKITETH